MIKKVVLILTIVAISIGACNWLHWYSPGRIRWFIKQQDSDWMLEMANNFLFQPPMTVTAEHCERSQGGLHDYYSEGDYWWPNPDEPNGPYIRRDGMSNPDNFKAHRQALRRMSLQVAVLTGAYQLTGKDRYARHAIRHLQAWFINPETRMTPHMKYSQAIKGRVPGRGVGIIDGIHFVEVCQAVQLLHDRNQLSDDDYDQIRQWFSDFINFLTTHEYGIDERERNNNHGTCWVMQVAAYARLTGNDSLLAYCRNRYKTVLLPGQMAPDGSFRKELARTKPYGYSLFNIDVMAMVCHLLSTSDDNLWEFETADGRSIKRGMAYIVPYIADKSSWPLPPDVMYWDEWPVRHPSLLFAGVALRQKSYIDLWKTLPPLPETDEGIRNFPVRVPILWF